MGFSTRFSTVAVALLGATLLLQETRSQLTDCAASTSTDFDYEVTLGTDFDIRWSVDTDAETISFEVSTSAEAWVGLGFSSDGFMVPSDSVIGLPDDSAVAEYDLTGKELDLVTLYDEQEITAGAVTQVTAGTTMTFTRPLAPATAGKETLSATPGDETWLIYAFGADNTLAYHGADENRGNALLDLFCGETGAADAATPAPSETVTTVTMTPLEAGETATPTATPVDGDGGGGGSTITTGSPTVIEGDASDAPTVADDEEGDDPAPMVGAAALVGGGGLWVAGATVAAAMLGAAMAVSG